MSTKQNKPTSTGPKATKNSSILAALQVTPTSRLSSVYQIINILTGQVFYIGGTRDTYRRVINHLTALRGGYHTNKELQKAFNQYGEDCFAFNLLVKFEAENIDADQLAKIETGFLKLDISETNVAKTAKAGCYSSNKGAKPQIDGTTVAEVKAMLRENIPGVIIARVKGISASVVSEIKNGKYENRGKN